MNCPRCREQLSGPHCSSCHKSFADAGVFRSHRRGGECLDPVLLGLKWDERGGWWRRVGDRAA